MQKYLLMEKLLSQSLNQIQLLDLYKQVPDHIQKTQILSRLKKILVEIPNQIETHPDYLKECNDRYYCFIFDQIADNLKRDKPYSLKFLYHIVSLRIKFWFVKKQFDDLFNLFMLSIEHNKMIIPCLVDFLIELIDTFQTDNFAQSQSMDKKPLQKYQNENHSRLSLTRKTNNSLFSDEMINRKTWKATKELNQALNRKCCFTKENKFQREFADFELNKFLIFANEVFNRAVVQNPNYDVEDDSQDQEEPLYIIKMSQSNILKTLQLIHKILTYDFFGDRKNIQNDDFTQKMPLIIPTKYSKLAQFHQFQNWIKNKNDFYRYQYLYFSTNNVELKIIIIKIFGDLLRIHQKFFKKEAFFKAHVENVLGPIKGLLENLQIKYSQDFDLAIVFGESINKLLANSVFPTFLNLCRAQFKRDFIESIDEFIHKEILTPQLLDVTLVRNFIGFFVQILEKLNINSSGQYRITDFKEDVENSISRMGQTYEETLLKQTNAHELRKQFEYFFGFEDSIDQLNLEYFKEFFNIFKFFTPRTPISKATDLLSKCKSLCSRIECCVYQYENLCRWDSLSVNDQKKKQAIHRHLVQCFNRLIEMVGDSEFEKRNEILVSFKIKMLVVSFFGQKLLNSKYHLMLIFDETQFMSKFTKTILELFFKIKLHNSKCQQNNKPEYDDVNTVYQYALQLIVLAVKLNEKLFSQRSKVFADMENINAMKSKLINKKPNEKQAKQVEENLKNQCESTLKELKYFENLVKQIKHCFTLQMNVFTIDESAKQNISLKAIYFSISQKQFQSVLEPIYKLYFVTVQKCQLHRKKHEKLSAKNEKQQKVRNPQLNFVQISQNETIEQAQNDDQCQVIEQSDLIQDVMLNPKITHPCNEQIQAHNLNQDMNPIAYFVYLNFVNEEESLKTQLVINYKNFIKKTNKSEITQNYPQNESQNNLSNIKKRSYNQIYDIKLIIERLQKEYYEFTTDQLSPIIVEVKFYLLKIISNLLKIFKQCRFEADVKKELINSMFNFVNREFQDILRQNYRFETSTNQMEEDRLMATKVQTLIGLFEGLISIHFTQEKTNLYNLEFLILFPGQQQQPTKKIEKIHESQKLQILQIFHSTDRISHLFNTVLNFIISFPESYLQNGFYPLIESQLISLIREIYFEFSQFITIYLFGLSTENWTEGVIDMLNIHKVILEEENSVFEKYAISVNNQNVPCVIWAHTVLLKYIQKVMQLSFHSENRQWLEIRNKELLPFLKQIILFFKRLSNEPDIIKIAFELDFVDNQISGCYFPSVVRKFYDTLLEFLRYFLGRFENLSVSFITEHLSFIECVYEMVEIGRGIKVSGVNTFIEREIQVLNEIKLFKYAPDTEGKKGSRKSIRFDESCRQYKGWQYIERLAISDQTAILQQLQAYEVKFKYYINSEKEYSQTVTMKQSSQQKSIVMERQIQMSGRKSRQIIQSIKKSPPVYGAETNWADVQDNYEQNNYASDEGEIELNGVLKDITQSSGKKKVFHEDQRMRDAFEDQFIDMDDNVMEIDKQNTDIQRPDSMNVNLDNYDQLERLNDDDYYNPNSSSLSPDKHQYYNDQTTFDYPQLDNHQNTQLHQQYHQSHQPQSSYDQKNYDQYQGQQEGEPLSQQLDQQQQYFSSPKQQKLIQGDELTTYDILETNDQFVMSPIKNINDELDEIAEQSQRYLNSNSQGFSRKGNYTHSYYPDNQREFYPYHQQTLSQGHIQSKSQPINHENSSQYYGNDNDNPYAVLNLTEPQTAHVQQSRTHNHRHSEIAFSAQNSTSNPHHKENSQKDNSRKSNRSNTYRQPNTTDHHSSSRQSRKQSNHQNDKPKQF